MKEFDPKLLAEQIRTVSTDVTLTLTGEEAVVLMEALCGNIDNLRNNEGQFLENVKDWPDAFARIDDYTHVIVTLMQLYFKMLKAIDRR